MSNENGFVKEVTTLADGRYLIYYDFPRKRIGSNKPIQRDGKKEN